MTRVLLLLLLLLLSPSSSFKLPFPSPVMVPPIAVAETFLEGQTANVKKAVCPFMGVMARDTRYSFGGRTFAS
jgi:hypothetical protein